MPRLGTETSEISSHHQIVWTTLRCKIISFLFSLFFSTFKTYKHATTTAEILPVFWKILWGNKESTHRYDWRSNPISCSPFLEGPYAFHLKQRHPLPTLLCDHHEHQQRRPSSFSAFARIVQTSKCVMPWSLSMKVRECQCVQRPRWHYERAKQAGWKTTALRTVTNSGQAWLWVQLRY